MGALGQHEESRMRVLRGVEVSIGDCVFVPTDGDSVRFGNLERFESDAVWASFRAEKAARRADAERFGDAEILLADEIGATPSSNQPIVGCVYVLPLARDCARVVRLESLDEETRRANVSSVQLTGQPATSTIIDVDATDLYAPALFARIAKWRFERISHPLVDVFQDAVGMAGDQEGAATLQLDDVTVPVMARARFRDYFVAFELDVHYQLVNLISNVDPDLVTDERLIPDPPTSMPWRADIVLHGAGSRWSESEHYGSISVKPRAVTYTIREATPIVTREIYSGAPWGAWSHPIYYREPPVNQLQLLMGLGEPPSSVQLNWNEVNLTFYRPYFSQQATKENNHLGVVFVGAPLAGGDMSVLGAFIGYCTGGRARNVATETYDMNGKLSIQLHDRGVPTERRAHPMPLDQPSPYAPAYVIKQLPMVLNAMSSWRTRDERSFDAMFHHYAEGVESSYPVTRTLRLAVAFEAFVNLVTQDFAENEPIMDADFDIIRQGLNAELDRHRAPSGPLTLAQHERLTRKVDNLNSASNTRRQRAFWAAVPIAHNAADDDLLRRLRNESVHRGYVGQDQSREGLLAASADADRLTDLFNRAVLTYAGYTGPVRSSADSSWIEPITAGRFRVPALPPNPTLELQMTSSAPPMSTQEQAAHDALLLRQRAPIDPHYIVDLNVGWPI